MKKKVAALRRIERLNAQMHDLANWRLAALGRERQALDQDHREMTEAASRGLAAHGPLAAAASRRIRAVETQIEAAKAEQGRQAQHAIERASRAKIAERASSATQALYASKRERDDLADLVERAIAAKMTSSAQG